MRLPRISAVDSTARVVLADRVLKADTFLSRLVGLLGRDSLDEGEALWISPCKGVHTMGMRFPIDVIFLDESQRVVATREWVKPWRATRFFGKARSVLELKAGSIRRGRVSIGDQLALTVDHNDGETRS